MSFEIVGPEGQRYELSSVDAFLDTYEPQGFIVAPDQPHWSDVPDIKAVKAERKEKAKAKEAKKDTPTTTTTPAPEKKG